MISIPEGITPIADPTTEQILYGSRETSYRFELFAHSPTTGADSLIGFLDGVEPESFLKWIAGASVKKSGELSVLDIVGPIREGFTRISDVNLVTTRIRPVRVVVGLPDDYLGMYVVTSSPEHWDDTGRTYKLGVHDKSTVLLQDAFEETFTAGTSDTILEIVQDVIESAGELITIDGADTSTLAAPRVWPAGTSKLTIVNELLVDSLAYRSLWVDGVGNFRAIPYVEPAARSVLYAMLNGDDGLPLRRELVDGVRAIYSPEWIRRRDNYAVPNKVIAIASGSASAEPLSGVATNEDPDSPFSYQARGNRWVLPEGGPIVVDVPDFSAEGDPVAAEIAFLNAAARRSLIARSSVQAAVSVKCLPVPLELLEVLRFANVPAGVDARHTVQQVSLPLKFDGLLALELQEVVGL